MSAYDDDDDDDNDDDDEGLKIAAPLIPTDIHTLNTDQQTVPLS